MYYPFQIENITLGGFRFYQPPAFFSLHLLILFHPHRNR